jgi:CubicO group peptidase (beta-lactamase class C family)
MLLRDPASMTARAFANPPRSPAVHNTRAWRAAEIPSSNGHTTARALARIYGALAQGGGLDGVHLLHPATIEAAMGEQSSGPDAILRSPNRYGLGFLLPLPEHFRAFGFSAQAFGPHPRAFGHWGSGGSVGFADVDGHIGFGYVMNQLQTGTLHHPDRRWPSLVEAVYTA